MKAFHATCELSADLLKFCVCDFLLHLNSTRRVCVALQSQSRPLKAVPVIPPAAMQRAPEMSQKQLSALLR